MDQNLQQKIDEARKNGYTDEEIQQYLATSQQPVPQQTPIDRTEEYTGLAQGMGIEALKNAALIGGGYLGAKGLLGAAGRAFGNRPMPAPPITGPVAPPMATPPMAPAPVDELTDWYNRGVKEKGLTPHRPAAQPSMIDRAGQTVRNLAANKAVQNMTRMATSPTSMSLFTPGAVMAGGTALSNMATQQMRGMSPEQRKQFYSSPMMGAMSGDAGLAAAIMNAGQQ